MHNPAHFFSKPEGITEHGVLVQLNGVEEDLFLFRLDYL